MENSSSSDNSSRFSSIFPITTTQDIKWAKWQCLGARWSNPDLGSLPSSVTVFNRNDYFLPKTDEESTGSFNTMVDDEDEAKKKSLIALCKALMLYGAPCHRIVN